MIAGCVVNNVVVYVNRGFELSNSTSSDYIVSIKTQVSILYKKR